MRACVLRVRSPTSYQAALPRDLYLIVRRSSMLSSSGAGKDRLQHSPLSTCRAQAGAKGLAVLRVLGVGAGGVNDVQGVRHVRRQRGDVAIPPAAQRDVGFGAGVLIT